MYPMLMACVPDCGRKARTGLVRRISVNSFHLLFQTLLGAVTSLAVVGIVLNALGVEDYGVYVSVGCLTAVILRADGVLQSTACRFLGCVMGKGSDDDLSDVWSSVLLFAVTAAVVLFVSGELIGSWILRSRLSIPPERMEAAQVVFQGGMAVAVLKTLQTAFSSLVVMEERMACFSLVAVLESALTLGAAGLLRLLPTFRLEAYVLMLFAAAAVVLGFHIAYCRRLFPQVRFVIERSHRDFGEIARFFMLRMLTGAGNAIKIEGVALLVNSFAGVVASAGWGIVAELRIAFQSVCDSYQKACSPTIYKRISVGDQRGTRRFLRWEVALSVALVALPALVWLVFSRQILKVWLGEDCPAGLMPLVACSILWSLVDVVCSPLTVTILACGRIALFQVVMFAFSCLCFGGVWMTLSKGLPACVAMAVVVTVNALSLVYRLVHIRRAGILREGVE